MSINVQVYATLPYKETDSKILLTRVVAETRISCHWANLAYYCPNHLLVPTGSHLCNHMKCRLRPLWSFNKDCHRRRNEDVAGRAQYALNLLRTAGIQPGVPPHDNENWYDGLQRNTYYGDTLLPTRERLGAFAFLLTEILRLSQIHTGCFFLGDQYEDTDEEEAYLIVPDNKHVPYEFAPKESIPPPSPLVVYFYHPTDGCIKVDSFYKALEVYDFLESRRDPNAYKWFDVARRMPDAPVCKKRQ